MQFKLFLIKIKLLLVLVNDSWLYLNFIRLDQILLFYDCIIFNLKIIEELLVWLIINYTIFCLYIALLYLARFKLVLPIYNCITLFSLNTTQ